MPYRFRVLGFLFCASIITFIDRVCISVAEKDIRQDLGISLEQWGWILGAFVFAYGLFEIPGGALGDKFGPRKILTRIVAWWSAFTILTGFAKNFHQLIVIRFLFGAGEAGAFPNFSAAIARWFPVAERARAQSIVWMGSRLGAALSPLIVIPIQHALGWRAAFYIFGAVGILWAAVWFFWFRDNPRDKKQISESELQKITGTSTNPETPKTKTPWKQIFSQPNLWWIMLMYHANAWCGFFYLTWMITFLREGRHFTASELVAFSWLPFVFGAIANLLGGITSDALVKRIGLKWGRRSVGAGGLAVATLFLTLAFFTQAKIPTILCLALAYGFSDFALPVAWAVCLDVGQKNAGLVTGAMNTAGQVGSFFTTVLFGYIVVAFNSYNAPLIPIAIMSLVGTLAWLKIDPTKQLTPSANVEADAPAA